MAASEKLSGNQALGCMPSHRQYTKYQYVKISNAQFKKVCALNITVFN